MTKITNVSTATQGINARSGTVFLRPGTSQDVELAEGEDVEELANSPHLSVEGYEKPEHKGKTLGELNAGMGTQQPDEDAAERERYIEEIEGELTTARSAITSLTDDNTQLKADLDEARGQLLAIENEKNGVQTGLVGRHKGGGSYSVFQGDTEILGKLTGEQSTEFNALADDAAKSQWVKEHTPAADTE